GRNTGALEQLLQALGRTPRQPDLLSALPIPDTPLPDAQSQWPTCAATQPTIAGSQLHAAARLPALVLARGYSLRRQQPETSRRAVHQPLVNAHPGLTVIGGGQLLEQGVQMALIGQTQALLVQPVAQQILLSGRAEPAQSLHIQTRPAGQPGISRWLAQRQQILGG